MSGNDHDMLQSALPFWDKLTDNQKELLQNNARPAHYDKGQIILGYKDECLGLLVVRSGRIGVYIISEEGREIMLFRLNPGDVCVLSASCVIQQITFDVHLDAEEDTDVTVINVNAFSILAKQNIYVECFTYKLATEHFSDVMWAIQQLLFFGFDKRLAVYLYDETVNTGSDCIKITHEQIAKHINSAREVVTRMLNRFEEDGIVGLGRGTVTIKDKAKLKKLLL